MVVDAAIQELLAAESLSDEERRGLHRRVCRGGIRDRESLLLLLRGCDLDSKNGSLYYGEVVEALASDLDEFGEELIEELKRVRTHCEQSAHSAALWALSAF